MGMDRITLPRPTAEKVEPRVRVGLVIHIQGVLVLGVKVRRTIGAGSEEEEEGEGTMVEVAAVKTALAGVVVPVTQ